MVTYHNNCDFHFAVVPVPGEIAQGLITTQEKMKGKSVPSSHRPYSESNPSRVIFGNGIQQQQKQ